MHYLTNTLAMKIMAPNRSSDIEEANDAFFRSWQKKGAEGEREKGEGGSWFAQARNIATALTSRVYLYLQGVRARPSTIRS